MNIYVPLVIENENPINDIKNCALLRKRTTMAQPIQCNVKLQNTLLVVIIADDQLKNTISCVS